MREPNADRRALKVSDMDVTGVCFAMRFVTGSTPGHRVVEFYIEDDENYHFKCRFDRTWLGDLAAVVSAARDQ